MNEPLLALADDLTGACEIAGIALNRGLRARVTTDFWAPWPEPGELLVFDTETRLARPIDAKRRLVQLCERCADRPVDLLYKKTDSVLRGPVVAELESVALTLGYDRVLLVPANPGLGRTVIAGRLRINGVPLTQTVFAQDPHHPAASDDAKHLLGPSPLFPTACAHPGDTPAEGALTVGDAQDAADLARWAGQLSPSTLAAGAAEWFDALLAERGRLLAPSAAPFVPAGPVLVLSGTTASNQRAALMGDSTVEWLPSDELKRETVTGWLDRVERRLRQDGRATAAIAGPVVPDNASGLRAALAAAAQRAARISRTLHVVIEGGATAAAVLRILKCATLSARHVWTPGVVSLVSTEDSRFTFTLKPGSYPWPHDLSRSLFGASAVTR